MRKIGLKMVNDRSDRQNEVWAGKTVNMASKLASLADSTMLVSDRYYENLRDIKSRYSCGCGGNGTPTSIWDTIDVSGRGLFDFDTAYQLKSKGWCETHGKEYCEALLLLDSN